MKIVGFQNLLIPQMKSHSLKPMIFHNYGLSGLIFSPVKDVTPECSPTLNFKLHYFPLYKQ